jgi:acetylornithine deacetylase/succinyl-diaminopimelate desuccinylase-like protein
VFTREGGSIPVVATFQEELGLPSVLFGVGLPDENAHAPNEKLDLGNFHGGVIASAYLYQEIAQLRPSTHSASSGSTVSNVESSTTGRGGA